MSSLTSGAPQSSTLDLIVRLGNRCGRAEAAQALASRLGAETLLLFVRDPEVGVLIPAPGLPQTLHGGRTWRSFLARCAAAGRYADEVEFPQGTHRSALAVVLEGTAVVAVGGTPLESEVDAVGRLLPMLAALLGAEQDAVLARAGAAAAMDATNRAQALATALEAARAEASRLNAALRDEHRRKDEFLAMLGHELRNPLAPLVNSIELLRARSLDSGTLERVRDIMARQIGQLSRLVEDLLDVSRVSRGRIELRRQRLLVSDVLADALEQSRPLLDARQHEVEVSGTHDSIAVSADPVRLIQIFGNLINNAAKYTDRGGRITITVGREGEYAVVRIQDTGIGIVAEMLPRIFELFTQAPVALEHAQGGLGIGLTLVRTLVELHGGRASAESAGAGLGSTFSVHLPLVPAAEVSSRSASAAVKTSTAQRTLRVLVVDDNEDAADSLAAMLGLMGHLAKVAYDGAKALQLAPEADADLILLDIGLPGLDGYEVARRLKRIARKGARFVALTGYGTDASRQRSLEAGFDEHVVKPVTAETLESIIVRTIKDRGPWL